jgi:hypothetical protein
MSYKIFVFLFFKPEISVGYIKTSLIASLSCGREQHYEEIYVEIVMGN